MACWECLSDGVAVSGSTFVKNEGVITNSLKISPLEATLDNVITILDGGVIAIGTTIRSGGLWLMGEGVTTNNPVVSESIIASYSTWVNMPLTAIKSLELYYLKM